MNERRRERLMRVVGPLLGLCLLIAAAVALERELAGANLADILAHVYAVPPRSAVVAIALTIGSYFALTGYDLLAVRYLGHSLAYGKIALTSFVAYVFSHNLGLSGFGASAVRYRFFSAFGIPGGDVVRVVALDYLTFWLGFFAVAGTTFLLVPLPLPPPLSIVAASTRPLGALLLATLFAYVGWAHRRRGSTVIRGFEVPVPGVATIVRQLVVSTVDFTCAAGVLYILLPDAPGLTFAGFVGAYALAVVLGVVSNVPGGLGVLDTTLVVLLRPYVAADQAVAALLLYRLVYYLIPMAAAGAVLVAFEGWQRREQITRTGAAAAQVGGALVPRLLSFWVAAAGIILLLSGATPAIAERFDLLQRVVPLTLIEASHLLGSVLGVALLLLAHAIQRRIDAAYYAAFAFLVVGAAASLFKGFDWEEATALLVVAAILLPCRRYFRRHSALLSQPYSLEWALLVIVGVVGTVILTLWAHRNVEYANELWWRFELDAHASRSLRAIVAAAIMASLWPLARVLRPAVPDTAPPMAQEIERVRPIVAASPRVQAHLALLGDKRLLFHPEGDAFVMYGVQGRSWIAMGDPCGPPERHSDLIWQLAEEADRHGAHVAFYEVGPGDLPAYIDAGMSLRKLGECARVPLTTFTMDGPNRKDLRYTHRRAEKEGCNFELVAPENVPPLLDRLAEVSNEWLRGKNAREKRFSLGYFDRRYLSLAPIAVVRKDGEIVAFANVWLGGGKEEMSIDLMRYSGAAPRNVMEYLFGALMLWGASSGYRWFELGMAPLSGLESHRLAPVWNKLGTLVFEHGEHFYNFQGLRTFKEKFDPIWEPRFLAIPEGIATPVVLLRVAALISGGVTGIVAR
jgi:phosphatidylglycerol lysyltransferase